MNRPYRTVAWRFKLLDVDGNSTVRVSSVYQSEPRFFHYTTGRILAAYASEEELAGIVTTLLVARQIPATLTHSIISVDAEALLVVEKPNKPRAVMVLGGERIRIGDNDVTLPARDVVIELTKDASGIATAQPILKPLDPPTVGPDINAFIDTTTVTLSTTSPNAVIRYTTETPASRMNDFRSKSAKRQAGKTTLAEAAGHLSLRESEGAAWKLYTGPFEISENTLVRAKDIDNQRTDLWRNYPYPATTWRGIAPVLEISGPGLERKPVPAGWLKK